MGLYLWADTVDGTVMPWCNYSRLNCLNTSSFRSELEDFKKGMKHCGILQQIKTHPSAYRELLVPGNRPPLKGRDILKLFEPLFSEVGANVRGKEEELMEFWVGISNDDDVKRYEKKI
jgi:hypothetical protein